MYMLRHLLYYCIALVLTVYVKMPEKHRNDCLDKTGTVAIRLRARNWFSREVNLPVAVKLALDQ